jgi:hypothetical protein
MEPISRSTYARCHGDRGAESNFFDLHVLHLLSERGAEDLIAIAEQIPRDFIKRKCLAQLLCRPFRRGMRGDIKMNHPTSVVR